MYCNGIQSYRKTNITTSDPMRLVIMCYEGAIDSLKLAKEKMKEKNYEKKGEAIIKAQDIIDELLCSLDLEKGGAIASNLSSLYNYMLRRILHGDVKLTLGTAELFDRVLFNITDSYEGYAAFKQDSLQNSIDGFETRIEEMEARLDRKMEMMINRFVAMESALSVMQSQSQWLTGQINASYSGWG